MHVEHYYRGAASSYTLDNDWANFFIESEVSVIGWGTGNHRQNHSCGYEAHVYLLTQLSPSQV